MFDDDLPKCTNEVDIFTVVRPEMDGILVDSDVVYGSLRTTATSILALFVERGPVSGHCYQPLINHRDLDYQCLLNNHFNENGVEQRALKDALVKPEQTELFDRNSQMTFFMYEVIDGEGETPLRSHCMLYNNANALSRNPTPGHVYVKGRSATAISANCFKRLCEVFGMEWRDEVGESISPAYYPTVYEAIKFFSCFHDHSLKTPASFKKFLKSFQLERIYRYDDNLEPLMNARYLGRIIRHICGFRLGCFEGQHRWYIMVMMLSAYYKSSDSLIFKSDVPFSDVFTANHFNHMQCWRSMEVRFGVPIKSLTTTQQQKQKFTYQDLEMKEVRPLFEGTQILRSYGQVINMSQNKSVAYGYAHFYRDWVTRISQTYGDEWQSLRERFKFSTFFTGGEKEWNTEVLPQLELLWKQLMHIYNDNTEYGKIARCGKTLMKTWVGKSKGGFMASKYIITDKPPEAWNAFLNWIKFCCLERANCAKFLILVSGVNPATPQTNSSIWDVHSHYFKSHDWITCFIHQPLRNVMKKVEKKLLLEKKIIHVLRQSGLGLDQYHDSCVPANEYGAIPLIKEVAGGSTQLDGAVKSKARTLISRIQYAIGQTLFFDILDVLQTHGYSPNISTQANVDLETNRSLIAYMS